MARETRCLWRRGAKTSTRASTNFGLEQLKGYAKSVTSLPQLIQSPLFQHTLHSADAFGMSPEERVKGTLLKWRQPRSAVQGIASMTGLSSEDAKRQAAQKQLQNAQAVWPQFATSMGVKYTEGFGQAIIAEASRQVEAKLQEDAKQQKADPMKYAASVERGTCRPRWHAQVSLTHGARH